MNKLKVSSVVFAIIFLTITMTIHQASGEYTVLRRVLSRCIRRYGHSCLGGHGKRSQIPPINIHDMVMSRSLSPFKRSQTNIVEQLSPPPLPPYGMGVMMSSSQEEEEDDKNQRLPSPVVDFERQNIILQKLMRMNGPYNDRFVEDDANFNKK